uniref:Uncharacterized protein n=1 Tax=Physcomitrium patens TaxID=3218 RepID=A0A2K1IXX4_PHYPA|nr:hypothetical protein PHYPA_023934 [Physcomitrium patens]
MTVLGGTFSVGPGSSELGFKTTIRLVLFPPIRFGVVLLPFKRGATPHGHKMVTVTGILLGDMTGVQGCGERNGSAHLFWQHVSAVVMFAARVVICLKIVSPLCIVKNLDLFSA